jgi:hypothetical protein
MSTQQTDMGRDKAPPQMPPLHEQDTFQEEKVFPGQTFQPPPRPPRRPPRLSKRRWFVGLSVAVVLVLILSISTVLAVQLGSRPGNHVTPTATPKSTPITTQTPGADITPTPEPGVVLGPLSCPKSVKDPAYWDAFVSNPPDIARADSVSCGNLKGTPTLQALVVARLILGGGPTIRSVFVFDNITSKEPTLLFKVTRLLHGDAKISGYSTIMTAEVDQNSAINKGQPENQLTLDLFREFKWSDGAGTFVQTAFPGIYPDLTRYQAEANQALVNSGQDSWKNNPARVAQNLALEFFQWKRSLSTKIISGGGPQDVSAVVSVEEPPFQGAQSKGPNVTVTLSRLEGNTHNMWVATAVEDGSMLTLTNIEHRSLITSPVKLEGKGAAFEAVIGQALILDHLYNNIGHAQVMASGSGMGISLYSTNVIYTTTFKKGVQEGIVEVQEANGGISDEVATAVMVKVLLNPEPGVALGEVPCPDAVKDPQHWNAVLGLSGDPSGVGGVSCANMKGNPSLQALLTVFHRDTDMQDVYVFDRITDRQPVQLFRLQGLYKGSALISGYSTVMTAEVDRNSSINQGKSGDQLTVDLYREFQWSDGAGTFVQVAFPGIFPDLTRYQAELDQRNVNAGQDLWKNDASKVALNLAVKLLNWSSSAQTTVLSGGGPEDVDAVVQVQSTGPAHPMIRMILSRLEGNTQNLWVAIGVESDLMSITSPQKWDRLTSPVSVKGTGSAFEGDVGTLFVLDHLCTDIGHAKGIPASNGKTTFTATIPYNASFHGGTQEGVLAFYRYSMADGAIAGVVMMKVLVSA